MEAEICLAELFLPPFYGSAMGRAGRGPSKELDTRSGNGRDVIGKVAPGCQIADLWGPTVTASAASQSHVRWSHGMGRASTPSLAAFSYQKF